MRREVGQCCDRGSAWVVSMVMSTAAGARVVSQMRCCGRAVDFDHQQQIWILSWMRLWLLSAVSRCLFCWQNLT